MVIMLKRRVAKGLPSQVSTHERQWLWSGFLDGDCLDASPGANLFQLWLPLWTWIEFAFGVAQVKQLTKDLAQPATKLFSHWILYRKHLARKLFGVCCIWPIWAHISTAKGSCVRITTLAQPPLAGSKMVLSRDHVLQKRWSCEVVGSDRFRFVFLKIWLWLILAWEPS